MNAAITCDILQFPIEPIALPIPECWYILRVHPNYDIKAERQLTDNGVHAYVPKEPKTIKSGWGRRVARQVAIFPGTVFIPNFDAELGRLKDLADGIGGYIRRGSEPLRVSLFWMDQIRKFEAKMQRNPNKRKFKVGDAVRVNGGPFDLWEAKIVRLDSRYRIVVLIDLLGAKSSLELDEDQVEAV